VRSRIAANPLFTAIVSVRKLPLAAICILRFARASRCRTILLADESSDRTNNLFDAALDREILHPKLGFIVIGTPDVDT